jgi:ABC-type Fe3+/spermidine/putrescine transport system ATPase subunit
MVYLDVRDLQHAYGSHRVLDNISFTIAKGERLCLLGPSGCGKTTTLQVLAGFVAPDGGSVSLNGKRIDDTPPERRNIGIMFQSYALFPHMSVFENVAFGLRMRRMAKNEIRRRVSEALELVRLPHAGGKTPGQLSGGEQQRIAFARAVVIRPSLLLLDEPFSNLDARLRLEMRQELLALLRSLDIATLMVTHDQEEAMAIADRIAVMNRGRIEQIGTTTEIYDEPVSLFVGRFVGESNILHGRHAASDGATACVEVEGIGRLLIRASARRAEPSAATQIMIRPERIRLGSEAVGTPGQGWNSVEGVLEQVLFLGHRTEWTVRCGNHRLMIWQGLSPDFSAQQGDRVILSWRISDTVAVPEERAQ